MCSVICRVRMEFISCRVLRENIPHKPSPWWVGEGMGRLQTSWKTGDRTKTKGAPGSGPSSGDLGGDRLTFALLVQRHLGRPFSPPSGQIQVIPLLPRPPQCVCSRGRHLDAAAPAGRWVGLLLSGCGAGPVQRGWMAGGLRVPGR